MPSRSLGAEPAALESQLLKGEPPARIEAAKKLAVDKDPATADSLLAALKDAEPLVKRFAIYGLQRIGDRSAAGKIAALVTDKDPWVRRTAITALGRLGAKDCISDLLKALKDEDVHVRCDAFVALGRLGDPATQKPLLEAMQDKRLWSGLDVWDQMAILHVIERPFWTDRDAVPFLQKMVDYAKWPHPELEKFDQISRDARCLIISNGVAEVLATITDTINSDYPGRFDYDVTPGVAMWKGNFEYHYNHPRRPILAVNAFHDWGFKTADDSTAKGSNRNEGTLVKEFLLDVLVKNKDKYPDTYCVTYSQLLEYVKTADLKHTLAAGNCQDSRNPEKPTLDRPQP
jgi:hypothetical protein